MPAVVASKDERGHPGVRRSLVGPLYEIENPSGGLGVVWKGD